MAKIETEDLHASVFTSPPFTPEVDEDENDDEKFAVKFHDRSGFKYDVWFCHPDQCPETQDPTKKHVLVVANVDFPEAGVLVPMDIDVSDPDRFGPPPRSINEALAWTGAYIDRLKEHLAASGRPVL